MKAEIQRWQARIRELDERIGQAEATGPAATCDSQATAAAVTDRLQKLGERIDDLPVSSLRRLLEIFVAKAVIDLETRQVELQLRLPVRALNPSNPMCLDSTSAW